MTGCRKAVVAAAIFWMGSLGATGEAQSVLLGLRSGGVHYQLESFGRRVELDLQFFTGQPTLELCSRVDPDGVVLVLTLPAGTAFVSESRGGAVVDPVAGTVTWSLGTLSGLANCFGSTITTTLDVESSVPDGTMLTANAAISTTTPGDDPSDNAASVTFQGGMLPLEVRMDSTSFCSAGSDDASSDTGEALHCSESDPGILPGKGRASVGAMGLPRVLGELGSPPTSSIETPKVTVQASSKGGFDCDSGLTSCWPLSGGGEANARLDLEIQNPNPFEVPLHWLRYSFGHAGCSDNDALFPGSAYVEDSIPSLDCGASYDTRFPHGVLRLECDGLTGNCVRDVTVTSDDPAASHDVFASPSTRVPAFGTRELTSIFGSGDAFGDSNVFDFGDLIVIRSGYGYYNAATRTMVTLGGGALAGGASEIRFRAESPVDLLVTSESGERTGVDRGAAPPDPGEEVDALPTDGAVAEIAGSRYTGSASEPEEIAVGLPEPGTYRLEVFGTGDGPFRITVESRGLDGSILSQHVSTGDATAAMVLSQEYRLDADGTLSPVVSEPVLCDVDSDGDVDRSDVFAILAARDSPATGADDPRDASGDGIITIVDARLCVLECTRPLCAVE